MKRTKLALRTLPSYTQTEECMNMVTHIVGGAVAIAALVLCVLKGVWKADVFGIVTGSVYGGSMLALYAMSSIYHGLQPGMAKKVLQVLDHCTIYFLIAGTYTPIALCAIRPIDPGLGWGMVAFQWSLTTLAVTLTAIDLKKYNVFSMICYIGMGWAILPFMDVAQRALGQQGFSFLLAGGITYTVGAILYGIGSKKPWFHSVFHIFVVLASFLQLVSVLGYAI